jgi:hypothetical protein
MGAVNSLRFMLEVRLVETALREFVDITATCSEQIKRFRIKLLFAVILGVPLQRWPSPEVPNAVCVRAHLAMMLKGGTPRRRHGARDYPEGSFLFRKSTPTLPYPLDTAKPI